MSDSAYIDVNLVSWYGDDVSQLDKRYGKVRDVDDIGGAWNGKVGHCMSSEILKTGASCNALNRHPNSLGVMQ